MTGYSRKIMAAVMICFVSLGVFAQKGKGGGKRPPKSETRVVVEPKREKPRQDKNQGEKRGGRRERPEEEELSR
jgi:hypothetical protein